MDPAFEFVTDEGKKLLCLRLPTLTGRIEDRHLLSLAMQPAEKLMQLDECEDPRQIGEDSIETLRRLPSIHRDVVLVAESRNTPGQTEWTIEGLLTAFSLTSVLILYFRQYELDQETWGCQLAWLHLLRLRYHTMVRLYERREEIANLHLEDSLQADASQLRNNFALARRDWINFCLNIDSHFLFSTDVQTGESDRWPVNVIALEDEVVSIFHRTPGEFYQFYLSDDKGKRVLDRIMADWFLRDRADWRRAAIVTWHRASAWLNGVRWHKALAAVSAPIVMLLVVLLAKHRWFPGQISWLTVALSAVYSGLLTAGVLGFLWRPIMDLLLPRLWAGTAVGYLPLFLTSELWKIVYPTVSENGSPGQPWWGSRWWGLFLLNLLAFVLAFFYLRWEVGNRLARTPTLSKWVSIRRALWLTSFGWLVSVVMGLVILDIAGAPMARACLPGNPPYTGTLGLAGNVHLKALFLFAPFALLVGVILQIFWEDKPITQTA
ncbi:MAG TPA: hypothetical protein VJH03_22060 [Blastocatellia bacterium]|nr:hypothetical protein [Blastocatellia bacterium]